MPGLSRGFLERIGAKSPRDIGSRPLAGLLALRYPRSMAKEIESPLSVLDFWFSPRVKKLWFQSTPAFDREVRERFEPLFQLAMNGQLGPWQQDAEGSLALVIVLDQFPLNMYRGEGRSFSGGGPALAAANDAIEKGFDKKLPRDRLAFLYLPFMHSEKLSDQDRSVELFEKAGLSENINFAHHHREIVRRFGRFPHRNAPLGRASTAEETAYLASKEGYLG